MTSLKALSLGVLLALLAGTFLPSVALAQEPLALTPVPADVRDAMLAGDGSGARRMLARHARQHPDAADAWLLLEADAWRLDGKVERAVEVLERLESDHPDSVWLRKARFRRAELLRQLGRMAEAEQILEHEARRLRGEKRQGELAQLYLDFAAELVTAPDGVRPDQFQADWAGAFQLCGRVLELQAPRPLRSIAQQRMAESMAQLGNHQRARQEYLRWLKDFDQNDLASATVRLASAREVMLAGNPAQARRELIDLDVEIESRVEERQEDPGWSSIQADALYLLAEAWAKEGGHGERVESTCRAFLKRFPSHRLADDAAWKLVTVPMADGRNEASIVGIDAFLQRTVRGDASDEERIALETRQQHALFLKAEATAQLGDLAGAIALYDQYIGKYPSGRDWAEAQSGRLLAEYQRGEVARKNGDYSSARSLWAQYLKEHPLDPDASDISLSIGYTWLEQADDLLEASDSTAAVTEQVAELRRRGIAHFERMADQFSGTDEASEALYAAGEQLETELHDLPEAIRLYRLCDFGRSANFARQRLATMTTKELRVQTVRTWRSNEIAKVQVQVRNTEKLQVSLYRLDLETYFRKHLTHTQVEDLDLDLIAPDASFEVAVEDYEPYRPIRQDIELPDSEVGVWAVAVSDGERRATTLVLHSDLDMVVKASREEMYVYVQDMRLGVPAEGVDVLAAVPGLGENGSPLLLHMRTDDSGVARAASSQLASADGLRMLAFRNGHYCGQGLDLGGLEVARGLQARSFVQTDRPAYRPGQRMGWKAILRDVENGVFSFEEGEEVQVRIDDPEGMPVWEGRTELSAFGTVHGELELDSMAREGTWTIHLDRHGEQHAQGSFLVQQFQLQKANLEISFDQDLVFRGERVHGQVVARWNYGEEMRGVPIELTMPDGRQHQLRTNDEGAASFEFDPAEMNEGRALTFTATLAEEKLFTRESLWFAATGYRLSLSVPGEVALVGSTLPVQIRCSDPLARPLERELELQLIRREEDTRGWTERILERWTVTTDESGQAEVPIVNKESGDLLLRVVGSDRFGNPVRAEKEVYFSGEDDDTLLRVLSDHSTLQVGAEVTVQIVDRAAAGLALVTFEGQGVFSYRLVELKQGVNDFQFAVDHAHFPNFVLAVAQMEGNRFHQAQSSFRVERQLHIEAIPSSAPWTPGGQAEVELRVTDQLGRPVVAELALAVVDEGLLDLFPDRLPTLASVFTAAMERSAGLRTESSCGFSYQGATSMISQAILDEQKRLEMENRWKAGRESLIAGLKLAESGEALRVRSLEPMEDEALEEQDFDADSWNHAIGLGGGAGGKYGKRGGRGGGLRGQGLALSLDQDAASAFWRADVVTDAEGRALVKFHVPDKSTEWRLTARAVSADTLVGESRKGVIARNDLFVELRTPLQLTEGDRPVFTARIHHLTEGALRADLHLRVRQGERQWVVPAEADLDQGGVAELSFAFPEAIPFGAPLQLELQSDLVLGEQNLRLIRQAVVPVQPWGVEVVDHAAGVVTSDRLIELELPPQDLRSVQWGLDLMLDDDRLLLDAALGRDPHPLPVPSWRGPNLPRVADTAGRLLGSCAVLELTLERGTGGGEGFRLLREQAASEARSLIALQRHDGGWSWTGRDAESRVAETGQAVLALAAARRAGLAIPDPVFDRASTWLSSAFQQAGSQVEEDKALILHALAVTGRGNFGGANRLHRMRQQLSPAGLAHTALALIAMDRRTMAADLVPLLAAQLDAADGRCRVDGNLPAWRNHLTMTALVALAVQGSRSDPDLAAELRETLLAAAPWPQGQVRGWVLAALAGHQAKVRPRQQAAVVQVEVNGESQEYRLDQQRLAAHLGADLLRAQESGRLIVRLAVQGGPVHFRVSLRGVTKGIPEAKPLAADRLRILEAVVESPAPLIDGRPVSTGFSVVEESVEPWRNPVESAQRGTTMEATVKWDRGASRTVVRDDLILRIPIPAGAHFLRDSLRGEHDGVFQAGRVLWVALGGRESGTLHYRLAAVHQGTWHATPIWIESASDPAHRAFGATTSFTITVDEVVDPNYRSTPDELYHLGLAFLAQDQRQDAYAVFGELNRQFGEQLREQVAVRVAREMLFLALDLGTPQQVVQAFEALKERDPGFNVPFAEVMRVADAYRDLEEFERAALIFRAVLEENFGRELKLVGDLDQRGEVLGAVAMLQRLWLEYPDLPVVVDSGLALADRLLKVAPSAHRDPDLVAAGWGRSEFTFAGMLMLNRFLAMYADDPLAADAALNLVSARLEIEDFEGAAALAESLAKDFQQPRYFDAFRYTQAVALWSSGEDRQAMRLLQAIAEAQYPLEDGHLVPSENRALSLYILGQIHHARQEIARASEYYAQVEDQFADAHECLADFRQQQLRVEEVTAVAPGEKINLELHYRNLAAAEVLVYPVDLMTLYLRERDLSRVTSVNLAGIAPSYRKTVKLGADTSLEEATVELRLPLKDPGAYLVICRGDALHASGLVLVSDLELAVDEDPSAQQVRVQVIDRASGAYLRDVDVRVVGSSGGRIQRGRTDPRGIYSAFGVQGVPTVIARQEGGHYAFHRGTPRPGQGPEPDPTANKLPAEKLESKAYFRNVLEFNDDNVRSRQERLKKEQTRERDGVRVGQADG